jgi:hypothetical protein
MSSRASILPAWHHTHSQYPDSNNNHNKNNNDIQSLQSENKTLLEQLDHLNHQYETLETRIINNNKPKSMTIPPLWRRHHPPRPRPPLRPPNKKSAKPHPSSDSVPIPFTPRGLIDGRSNAEAAFAQKCQLLADFKIRIWSCQRPRASSRQYLVSVRQEPTTVVSHVS